VSVARLLVGGSRHGARLYPTLWLHRLARTANSTCPLPLRSRLSLRSEAAKERPQGGRRCDGCQAGRELHARRQPLYAIRTPPAVCGTDGRRWEACRPESLGCSVQPRLRRQRVTARVGRCEPHQTRAQLGKPAIGPSDGLGTTYDCRPSRGGWAAPAVVESL
jgi:hypothetical protein